MIASSGSRSIWVIPILLAWAVLAASGCSRVKYRVQADQEAYDAIAERNTDPRWCVNDYGIDMDARSRFFEPLDLDHPPMPVDDPASHDYLHCVNGMRGWKHWHDNGERDELENPAWLADLSSYTEVAEDGTVKLTLDSAIKLAYIHSPDHQNQLETLYLSSLDVTAERFRLDTQFFGGYDANYVHNGSLSPPFLTYNPTLGRFVITPAIDGVESNLLSVGRPSSGDPALQVRRRFATAGELLVGFANSFVFEFTGSDANLAASIANFSLVQPLLRGAGRDVALEQLTEVERDLLANLRAYSQYRQGFYTQVAIGELGVPSVQRFGPSTNVSGFSGQFSLQGGYLGLLQRLRQIRNTQDNLSLQLRTLALLEGHLDGGVIDLIQVDQFRQSIETERANLLQTENFYELSLETYKTGTLGLPPDLPIDLDDSLIRQFQLVAPEATVIQDAIAALQDKVGGFADEAGRLRADVSTAEIRLIIVEAETLLDPIRINLAEIQVDLDRMEAAVPSRAQKMTDEETSIFALERQKLRDNFVDISQQFEVAVAELEAIGDGLADQNKEPTVDALVIWLGGLYRAVQGSILVQARARLEAISVEAIDLDPYEAFDIALHNRLDFMNGRAALVDSWRLIQFTADALQSMLNVTAAGDVRTARNNPLSFRAPTGSLRLGLEFDAPFTRLLERNNYRQSLIDYQRNRRQFIQSRDSLHLGLRALLRQIELLRMNLEIQRRAVAIAIRRVDMTREALYAPVAPPIPGRPPAQFGPTAARNLLEALAALQNTQDNFMSVWLNYYAARMRLSRELGIMLLDEQGRWIEYSLPNSADSAEPASDDTDPDEAEPLPPAVPAQWLELADAVEDRLETLAPAIETADRATEIKPHEVPAASF